MGLAGKLTSQLRDNESARTWASECPGRVIRTNSILCTKHVNTQQNRNKQLYQDVSGSSRTQHLWPAAQPHIQQACWASESAYLCKLTRGQVRQEQSHVREHFKVPQKPPLQCRGTKAAHRGHFRSVSPSILSADFANLGKQVRWLPVLGLPYRWPGTIREIWFRCRSQMLWMLEQTGSTSTSW